MPKNPRDPQVETPDDAPLVARADKQDGHYEDKPGQGVKAVHQVKPATIPVQGPAVVERRGAREDTSVFDVAVTPDAPSVWEASPPANAREGEDPS